MQSKCVPDTVTLSLTRNVPSSRPSSLRILKLSFRKIAPKYQLMEQNAKRRQDKKICIRGKVCSIECALNILDWILDVSVQYAYCI